MPTAVLPLDEVSPAGMDGLRAAQLMQASKEAGSRVMELMSRRAIKRFVAKGGGDKFFNADELTAIRRAIEQTNSTANLLGRARIRERSRHVQERAASISHYSESQTFEAFADVPNTGVPPLPPEEGARYFQSLVPELSVVPEVFGPAMRRRAFTMALKSDEVMLKSVKSIIGDSLVTGRMKGSVPAIQSILEQAGVTPANPQYSEMVFRTNMMDSYNRGAEAELKAPDVAEVFPVWQYLGIDDGRQGDDHAPFFCDGVPGAWTAVAKYYPNSVTFSEVRGKRVYNCRCSFRGVDRYEWGQLEATGKEVESSW